MTPYEFNLKVKAYNKHKELEAKDNITLAYLNALWSIQWLDKKHRPRPLKEILNNIGKERKIMTDEQMFERIKVLNMVFDGEVRVVGF